MEIIRDKGRILAILQRDHEWPEGLDFITPTELAIQAGTWVYPKGKKLAAHTHKEYDRTANRTQEIAYVKRGAIRVDIYNEEQKLVAERTLRAGDFAVLVGGGHGYEILEEDTAVLEVKNGPFVSPEHDRVRFGPPPK